MLGSRFVETRMLVMGLLLLALSLFAPMALAQSSVRQCARGAITAGAKDPTTTYTPMCWDLFLYDPFSYTYEQDGGGHSSGSVSGNKGQTENDKDAKKGPCEGNPVLFATGNKIEPETDFEGMGEMPLYVERTYNSHWTGIGIFGKKWQSNLDVKLSFETSASTDKCYPEPGNLNACSPIPTQPTVIWAHRDDGRRIKFNWNAAAAAWLEEKAAPIAKIIKNADGSYTLTSEENTTEKYSNLGYVLEIKDAGGVGLTFTYTNYYLTRVTHTSGRYIQFAWTGSKMTSMTDPAGNVFTYTYLANRFGTNLHLLDTTARPGTPTQTIKYHYEDSRYLGALTGKSFNGTRYSTFTYDGSERATSSKHAGGVDLFSFNYTGIGSNITTAVVTNPLGKTATYQLTGGNITSVTGAASPNCQASYKESTSDANGYPDLVADFNANITDYDYGANGELQKFTEAAGTAQARVTQMVWDTAKNRATEATVVGVSKTTYTFTSDNRIASIVVTNLSANGVTGQTRTTTYSYTKFASGLLSSVTVDGPLPGAGDAVTYNYSSSGDLLTVVDSLGTAVTYSNYNGLGLPGHVVNRNGVPTDYAYDGRGRVLSQTTTVGGVASTTSYTYDGYGNLVQTVFPTGYSISAQFNVNGRQDWERRYESPDPFYTDATQYAEQQFTYDLNGDVTQVTGNRTLNWVEWDQNDHMIRHTDVTDAYARFADYDELGRLRARRGNNAQNTRYGYDDGSHLKTITDSLGNVTTLEYDGIGRVVKATNAAGGITRYEYDAGDNLTKVTDPRGLATTYSYDGFGQRLTQVSPDTGLTTYSYDAYGRLTSIARNDGTSVVYAYDALGRVTQATAGSFVRTFAYDSCTNGIGQMCSASDMSGSVSYAYDAMGRVTGQTSLIDGSGFTTGWTYDAQGRLTQLTYPNGDKLNYSYLDGRLSDVTSTVAGVTTNVVTGIDYQPMGPITYWLYGNGLPRVFSYDRDLRLTSISSSPAQSLGLTWNANDQLTQVSNSVVPAQTQGFSYDALSRVTSAGPAGGAETYVYDATGNRTSQVVGGVARTYAIDTGSNRLTALSGGVSKIFTFDSNGNRNGESGPNGVYGYSYDGFGRLSAVSRSGVVTSYEVNALGQRVRKLGSGSGTRFIYAPDGTLLAERTDAGTWTNYVHVARQPVALIRNGVKYYIHSDQLGRPEVVTNASKAVVWRASSFAFDRSITTDTIGGLNIGFPGQYFDVETGTWFNGFRDYDASVGRYLQSDPSGLSAGTNTYSYALNTPTQKIDPLGLFDVYGHGLPHQGQGYRYTISFYGQVGILSRRAAGMPGAISMAVKIARKVEKGTGVSDAKSLKEEYKCDSNDAKAKEILKDMGIDPGDSLTEQQLTDFLNEVVTQMPEMTPYYDPSNVIPMAQERALPQEGWADRLEGP